MSSELGGRVIDVIGIIHGIAQQQSGRNQLWRPALKDGVEEVRGRDHPIPLLDLPYYGGLFLRSAGTRGPAVVAEKPDVDTLAVLIQLQDEIIDPARHRWKRSGEDL
jgi:hypothetical protein